MRKWNVLQSLKGFSKYVVIPVICYIPAYMFIHTVFSFQENSWVTVAKAIPAEPNPKALSDQVDALSTRINILEKMKGIQGENLQEKYVKGLIESEAEKQAKEIVKDKTDQLKGELFGQIAFPVLAAIASIFAAFAVKDVLTKVLEKKERKELEQEVVRGIAPKMEKILKKMVQKELDTSIEMRLKWIEYEIAIISKDLSTMYGSDSDKKSILENKYKIQELATKYELDMAVSQLVFTDISMTENIRQETIKSILTLPSSVTLFSEDYFNADIRIKAERLKLMFNELEEFDFLENLVKEDIEKRINELHKKSKRNEEIDRGSIRSKITINSTQPDWGKNQP